MKAFQSRQYLQKARKNLGRPKFLNKTITTKRDFLNASDINTRGAKRQTQTKQTYKKLEKKKKTIETK